MERGKEMQQYEIAISGQLREKKQPVNHREHRNALNIYERFMSIKVMHISVDDEKSNGTKHEEVLAGAQ